MCAKRILDRVLTDQILHITEHLIGNGDPLQRLKGTHEKGARINWLPVVAFVASVRNGVNGRKIILASSSLVCTRKMPSLYVFADTIGPNVHTILLAGNVGFSPTKPEWASWIFAQSTGYLILCACNRVFGGLDYTREPPPSPLFEARVPKIRWIST